MPHISSLYVFVSFSCHLKKDYAIQKIHRDVIFSSERSAAPHACFVVRNRVSSQQFLGMLQVPQLNIGKSGNREEAQEMNRCSDRDNLSNSERCDNGLVYWSMLLVRICVPVKGNVFKPPSNQRTKKKRKTLLGKLISHTFRKI